MCVFLLFRIELLNSETARLVGVSNLVVFVAEVVHFIVDELDELIDFFLLKLNFGVAFSIVNEIVACLFVL